MRALATSPAATAFVERAWYGKRASPLLQAAAWGFAGASAVRNELYDRGLLRVVRLEVPAISVGNLVAGGAGKTPVVIALAERLVARGKRVAVLSRGYGGRPTGSRVNDGEHLLQSAAECGDEPWLIARRVPAAHVLVGPDRVELGREAVRELGAEIVLLDDGFQHRALARDEDILVLGGRAPLGNGRLLPAGPLREPVERARRASLAWLSNLGEPVELPLAIPGRRIWSRHRACDLLDGALHDSLGLGALKGRRVLAFAGIARPAPFFDSVAELGAELAGSVSFGDHHRYSRGDLERLEARATQLGAQLLVTTEKDAARMDLRDLRLPLVVVRIEVEITAGQSVLEELLSRC